MAITDEELAKIIAAGRKDPHRTGDVAVGMAFELSQRVLDEMGLDKEVKNRASEIEAAQLRLLSAFFRARQEGGVKIDEAIKLLKEHHKMATAAVEDPAAPSLFSTEKIRDLREKLGRMKNAIDFLSADKSKKAQLDDSFVQESRTVADWRLRQVLGRDYDRYKKMHGEVKERVARIGLQRREL